MKFILFYLFFASNFAVAANLISSKGKSEFRAVGRPSALKILGQGDGPTGYFDLLADREGYQFKGEVLLNLESLKTGIEMRDRHMKEKYLETGKFKNSTLKWSQVILPKDLFEKGGEVNVPGTLILKNVEKPVSVLMKVSKEASDFKIHSTFQIKLTDFSIDLPSYAGIKVADLVDIEVETSIAANDLNMNKK